MHYAIWALCLATLIGCGGRDDEENDTQSATESTQTDVNMNCDENPLRWDCGPIQINFEIYCGACHNESPMDYTSYRDVFADREVIRCGITNGPESLPRCDSSPQPEEYPQVADGEGPKPSQNERQLIVDWIDAGAHR